MAKEVGPYKWILPDSQSHVRMWEHFQDLARQIGETIKPKTVVWHTYRGQNEQFSYTTQPELMSLVIADAPPGQYAADFVVQIKGIGATSGMLCAYAQTTTAGWIAMDLTTIWTLMPVTISYAHTGGPLKFSIKAGLSSNSGYVGHMSNIRAIWLGPLAT